MPHIDFDLYRSEGVWRVKESEFCLFHLSPEDAENPSLLSVLGRADERPFPYCAKVTCPFSSMGHAGFQAISQAWPSGSAT